MKRVGFIINPIAGMGGRAGLKGTDGPETVEKARALGAYPEAAKKGVRALERMLPLVDKIVLITGPKAMGEDAAVSAGFSPFAAGRCNEPTTSSDTEDVVREMVESGIELLLFAGGDGTARNIFNVIGCDSKLPVIGIPAGVKIHSAVFAVTPGSAGDLALTYLITDNHSLCSAEVMDIDEEAFRAGRLDARLYGYLNVPCSVDLMQHLKVGSPASEESVLEGIAEWVVSKMLPEEIYIVGPGSTTAPIMKKLSLPHTLLGVDVIMNGMLLAADAAEADIIKLIEGKRAKIIVTVIGGQGYLFGRGNQQISPRVIRMIGRENIQVIALKEKLLSLEHQRLLVDTGDEEVDSLLKGYIRVITGHGEEMMVKI